MSRSRGRHKFQRKLNNKPSRRRRWQAIHSVNRMIKFLHRLEVVDELYGPYGVMDHWAVEKLTTKMGEKWNLFG